LGITEADGGRIEESRSEEEEMLKEFKSFIDRGNLLQLAVAFILGVTFAAVITSLVNDIIMPAVGLALGGHDVTNLFVVIKDGLTVPADGYGTLAAAQAAGAVTINYGLFINAIIIFIIVALVLFFMVKAYNKATKYQEPKAVPMKDCPECTTSIPAAARRCPACCADLSATMETAK
jgi:large conductance mechanosensitive channel